MAKLKKTDPDKTPEQPPAIPVDEYHGMGGSYVIDPATGKRIRVAGPGMETSTQAEQQSETDTEVLSDESK